MKFWIKVLFLVDVVVELAQAPNVGDIEIALVCVAALLQIVRERFFRSTVWIVLTLAVVAAACWQNPSFAVLHALVAFDFAYEKAYWGLPLLLLSLFNVAAWQPWMLLLIAFCSLLGYAMRHGEDRETRYRGTLDEERRLRYELEQTKAKLLQSNAEVAAIAEVKERNRLAREIHDSVGHSLAGNLIQLQAAQKLLERDADKAKSILRQSIERLSDTVGLLRDTVHNMKPTERLGVEYVKNVLANFTFCPIDFRYSGDFNSVPSTHLEALTTCLKEALTNAAKYSRATQMQVTMEATDVYSRLLVRDNGIGCTKIKEGLGLSGMRERVTNLGGQVSVHAEDGFLIVCFLPRGVEK